MKFIRKLFDRFKLQDERIFVGNFFDFEEALKRVKDPVCSRIGNDEYICMPKSYIGTMEGERVKRPIKVWLKVTQMNQEQLHLNFTAPLKPEFFRIMLILIVIVLVVLPTMQVSSQFYFSLLLWPLALGWFYYIIRAQEEAVIEILTKEMRLYKVKK